jgi:RNA polymerase sigma-70 factor, ECF subfamily
VQGPLYGGAFTLGRGCRLSRTSFWGKADNVAPILRYGWNPMGSDVQIDDFLRLGDLRAAVAASVEAYGPEILGFLVTFLRDEQEASEAFSQACEDLWAGIARFEGRASLRTWFYVLARHAAGRLRRSPHRRRGQHLSLSEISGVVESVRSRTLPHLRTSVKDRFAVIRDSLDEDDRALLVLRVDRDMSWEDIARVFAAGGASAQDRTRESARLRKRFQFVKDEIRSRAREAGLLPEEEG